MAARGSLAKATITEKILSTFDGSFLYNDGKEIRIPIIENGEVIQIKVALTAAKTNVNVENSDVAATAGNMGNVAPPTPEEQENVKKLIAALF